MKYFLPLILFSCSPIEPPEINSTSTETSAYIKCESMGALWQVECFCIPEMCISRQYACYFDMSYEGLIKNPEMADLYEEFHNNLIYCHETHPYSIDLDKCEDEELLRALKRCEKRLIDLEDLSGKDY